ncbi:MAG: hypothetical protein H6519_09770 [Microthrixaceae bacterium]|nr:hypothetical protein [Acidimicrobiales bacterium]MCB9404703.1 hypothetical protein [Microthrixaceae bacterium]
METPEDLTAEQFTKALDQSWASAPTGGTDLLSRMRDSIADIDTSVDKPKITKEEFLAELARGRR